MFPNIFLICIELQRIKNQRELFKKMLMHGLIIYLSKIPSNLLARTHKATLILGVYTPKKHIFGHYYFLMQSTKSKKDRLSIVCKKLTSLWKKLNFPLLTEKGVIRISFKL